MRKNNSTCLHCVCHRKPRLFIPPFPAFQIICLQFQIDSCLQSVFNGSSGLLVTVTPMEQEPQAYLMSDFRSLPSNCWLQHALLQLLPLYASLSILDCWEAGQV